MPAGMAQIMQTLDRQDDGRSEGSEGHHNRQHDNEASLRRRRREGYGELPRGAESLTRTGNQPEQNYWDDDHQPKDQEIQAGVAKIR